MILEQLKTYREVLARYHLQPEAKFTNADYLDQGVTQRRHIEATIIRNIGKEANKLEEQYYLGVDPEAQTDYGIEPGTEIRALDEGGMQLVSTELARSPGRQACRGSMCLRLSEVRGSRHRRRLTG